MSTTTLPENSGPIAYLTVVEQPDFGFCGGLLLLNDRGRPLEFHCNAPIRPSPTQRILFGSSLRGCLLTESIGARLVESCGQPPAVILVDLPDLWELSRLLRPPVGLIMEPSTMDDHRLPPSTDGNWLSFDVGGQPVAIWSSDQHRRPELESALDHFARRLPLGEPFRRIQDAIGEAHSSARLRESA